MSNSMIKPCHYCGGPGIVTLERDAWDIGHYWLQCQKCKAYVIADTIYLAAAQWNEGKAHYAK